MSKHLGIGFVVTPRPRTPAVVTNVTWRQSITVSVTWPHVIDAFIPGGVKLPPEVVEEET
jgi:hypothetical protein